MALTRIQEYKKNKEEASAGELALKYRDGLPAEMNEIKDAIHDL